MRQSTEHRPQKNIFRLKYSHSKPVIQVLISPLLSLSALQPSEIRSVRYKNAALPVKLCNCRRITTINDHDNDQNDDDSKGVVLMYQ